MPLALPALATRFRPPAGRLLPGCPYFRLLLAWVVVRTAGWVGVVLATQPTAPLDLVEWLSWGHTFQWGYPKHPPLPAWLAAGAARLSPGGVWGVYFLSYSVAAGHLLAAWQLGRKYLPPGPALVGAVCLDGLNFLTNDPAEWSNNVALGLGWAWTAVLARDAVATGSTRRWLAVGVVVGLTLLCKYTIGVLLVALGGYVVLTAAGRANLRRPGPYLAAAVAALIVAPHLVWLVRQNFITLAYAAERSADAGGWLAHVRNPVLFVLGQSYRVAPALLPLLPLVGRRGRGDGYLHAVVLGPLGLLIALSAATGCQLREIWGSPLWTFVGVWALVTFRATPDPAAVRKALRTAAVVALCVVGFVVVKQVVVPWATHRHDRPHFPGKALARAVGERWHARHAAPFAVSAGDGWRAGLVCVYSAHRPVLYSNGAMDVLEFDGAVCPWTGDDDLNRRGGVIVWDAYRHGDDLPADLRARFPRAIVEPPVVLPYEHPGITVPARTGLALVLPAP
jgi:hypothetical protein